MADGSRYSACGGDDEENGCGPAPTASAAAAGGKRVVDHARIERAVREILAAVGEDPDREGLLETPARVARMYAEMFTFRNYGRSSALAVILLIAVTPVMIHNIRQMRRGQV